MDSITVKLKELQKALDDFKREGMDCVNILLLESQEYDGEMLPASVELSAFKAGSPDFAIEASIESIATDFD